MLRETFGNALVILANRRKLLQEEIKRARYLIILSAFCKKRLNAKKHKDLYST